MFWPFKSSSLSLQTLAPAAKATVYLAPALAGKTTRLLGQYRTYLDASRMNARALWIAPTHRAADHVRGRLIESGLVGCLTPNIFTFAQFAEALLRASAVRFRPLDPLEKRQLIRRLIDQALAAKRLVYFAPIAGADGLVDLVCELFSDLKRQEIWPDQFQRICQLLGNPAKDRELADLYERYQQILNVHHLYDAEGRFWYTRDLLAQGERGPFADLSLVVVDGFADFTHTQHEILALLHASVDEILISLPWEAGRDELFHKSAATLVELEQRLPGIKREVLNRSKSPPSPAAATIAQIERQLFRDPRSIKACQAADGLGILAASGQLGEIELLAGRIKRLLCGLDPASGARAVRPGDIAVVFRSTNQIAPLVREVFDEFGIPYVIDSAIPLVCSPLLSALVAFLKLDLEDWPFRQVLDVSSSNYFRPKWPAWRGGAAAVDLERAVRALQIPKGRQALLTALERWAALKLDEHAAEKRRQRQAEARTTRDVLIRLAEAFDRLPASATADEWSMALEALAQELGMLSVAGEPCDLPIARHDAQAWQLLLSTLQSSMELETTLDGAAASLDRRALLDRIQEIRRTGQLPHDSDEAGRVRVVSAAGVRAIDVPYLFVAGLAEKTFPAAARDDRIYTAADHQRLNDKGLRFVEHHEQACEEMLLFYEVVTRARRHLWLSYSALDEAAQPLSPSPYLTEVERLFQPGAISRDESPNLSPIPAETEPFCRRDFRVKAMAMAIDGSARLAGRWLHRPAERESAAALLSSLSATAERSRREAFGRFEGMLLSPQARKQLVARFGPEHCWSTSQLEQYGYCPHQFFLERVLGIKAVDDVSLEVNHFVRGRRVHAVLAEVHRQLNAAGEARSPTACQTAEFQSLVAETLAAVMQRTASDGPLDSGFDAIDELLIARWVQKYLEQYAGYEEAFKDFEQPPVPRHFEVSFGPVNDDDDLAAADPLSTPLAYELTCNGMAIRLSGRVDRIDIGLVEGQVVFNVLDYKTSAAKYFRQQDVLDGRMLQLPLYAMAVEDLLLAGQNAMPWHSGYWHIRDAGFDGKRGLSFHERGERGIRRTELWRELRQRLVERVAALVGGIRAGDFPMHCEDKHCAGQCGYKTVCRVQAVRSLEKTWHPPSNAIT
jgi:ATP-dependent helicase/DNAse subunit B